VLATQPADAAVEGRRDVTVMTLNLYLGSSLAPALDAARVPRGAVDEPPRGFDSEAYVRTVEARGIELLDRSVERALEGAIGALEARESERLEDRLDRALERQIEGWMVFGTRGLTCAVRRGAMPALVARRCGDRSESRGPRRAGAPPAASRRANTHRALPLCCVALNGAAPTDAAILEIETPESR